MSLTTVAPSQRNTLAPGPGAAAGLEQRSFLADLVIEHGPIEVLGTFFLAADRALRERGLAVSFAPLEELIETNRRNSDTWRPIVPLFDPALAGCTPHDTFCLLGRNSRGEVVAAQAARFYDLAGETLRARAESLRLFYADPAAAAARGERCIVTAPMAERITGRAVFSGAIWYRPDWRGLQLSAIMPRISRAYAHARWNTEFTVSFVTRVLIDKGVVQRYGYTNIDWSVALRRFPLGDYDGGLLWMPTAEMLADIAARLSGRRLNLDGAVDDRGAKQHALAARAR